VIVTATGMILPGSEQNRRKERQRIFILKESLSVEQKLRFLLFKAGRRWRETGIRVIS
jgi:hypothetical protein